MKEQQDKLSKSLSHIEVLLISISLMLAFSLLNIPLMTTIICWLTVVSVCVIGIDGEDSSDESSKEKVKSKRKVWQSILFWAAWVIFLTAAAFGICIAIYNL